jgi:hypothetical protein
VPGAQVYNPSYSGGWDQEDQGPRLAQANSSRDPISKTTRAKRTGAVAQVTECLLCKQGFLSSNPVPPQKKKKNHNQVRNYILLKKLFTTYLSSSKLRLWWTPCGFLGLGELCGVFWAEGLWPVTYRKEREPGAWNPIMVNAFCLLSILTKLDYFWNARLA